MLLTLLLVAITLVSGASPVTQTTTPINVIIVRGSSGMGKAAALATVQRASEAQNLQSNNAQNRHANPNTDPPRMRRKEK